jgi:hypothetical protein
MTDKIYYKKIRRDIINGKKRCIYMKPKGKCEYVKSGGDFVLLSAYIKALQKKIKNKGGDGEGTFNYHPDKSNFGSRVNKGLRSVIKSVAKAPRTVRNVALTFFPEKPFIKDEYYEKEIIPDKIQTYDYKRNKNVMKSDDDYTWFRDLQKNKNDYDKKKQRSEKYNQNRANGYETISKMRSFLRI